MAEAALRLLEVDEHGFDEIDRRLLRTIIDKFAGGPVGLNTISAAISEEKDAIEDIYEPFLIQIGFLDRTPRGRVATAAGVRVLRAPGARPGNAALVSGVAAGVSARARRRSVAHEDGQNLIPDHRPPGMGCGRPTEITSLATYLPPRLLTNSDLEKMVDTTSDWILQRTGILERHIVDPGVATSDLGKEAALQAIAQAGLTPDDIDLIIVGTTTPDMFFPSTAALIQHKIGASRAWGFDLAGRVLRVHLLARHRQPARLDRPPQPRARGRRRHDVEHHRLQGPATCVLFGDGAGAVVVSPAKDRGLAIIDFAHEIDGSGGPALNMPAGGSLRPASAETVEQRLHYVKQDGQAVFKFAVRKTEEISRLILQRNNITADDLALFVSHQANRRIITAAADRLGIDASKVIINLERYGNTTAATIPLALSDAMAQGRLKKGDLVLLASVGAGFTVGSVLVRWAYSAGFAVSSGMQQARVQFDSNCYCLLLTPTVYSPNSSPIGRSSSTRSHTDLITITSGTARSRPGRPHTQPQKSRPRKTATAFMRAARPVSQGVSRYPSRTPTTTVIPPPAAPCGSTRTARTRRWSPRS